MTIRSLLCLASASLLLTPWVEAQVAFATAGSDLVEVDFGTGTATPIGSTGLSNPITLSSWPNSDELFVSELLATEIYSVNVTTAAATLFGSTTIAFGGLTLNEDTGRVYGHDFFRLYEVDPVTLNATLVGDSGTQLYSMEYHQSLGRLFAYSLAGDTFLELDMASGAATPIGTTGVFGITGMWYDPATDALYGVTDQNGNGSLVRIDPATGAATVIQATGLNFLALGGFGEPGLIKANFCGPAAVNSTGLSASISGFGSSVVLENDVTLAVDDLPGNAFGFFITSRTQGFVANPAGSSGNLCLAGAIGRFVGPGQIQNSGTARRITITLDLMMQPTPTGFVAIQAGESWSFSSWYRDTLGGATTSNFSDGLEVTFL
ncbi:hypothetical protein Poly30_30220 [Planctomycetes bacterium Poly30]|uniref:DUF4394 domain-containing protein n=1 Tax=Saltatorellus ferox TaxID=2528018 RepID=A0A518ETT1_9BACT|nr:hypothetical protein Poly30_30220 [Planctomycetes bacterium Poly30]